MILLLHNLNYMNSTILKKSILRLIFLVLTLSSCSSETNQTKSTKLPFKNQLALPSKHYMLSDTQNNMFAETFTKRWRPYDYSIRFSGTQKFTRVLSNVASVTTPEESKEIKIALVENNHFKTIDSSTTKVIVGKRAIGSKKVSASIIGDSYTQGGFFKDALLNKGNVPNLNLIGLRKNANNQYDEGRGGWKLSTYFSISKSEINYNPLFHPENKKYWGSLEFWKNAHAVFNKTAGNSFEPKYSAGRYDDYLHLFDGNSGLKQNPSVGDVMYDNKTASFIEWDGSSWTNKKESTYTWEINYPKYISMWKLNTPDFLFVMLGVNDFINENDPENIDFSIWNHQMIELKKSYLSSNPKGKFVIVIPCSTFGKTDSTSSIFTTKANASLWSCRKNIIDTFDLREDEQIYVLDGGINIDAEYGYKYSNSKTITKPFDTYNGNQSLKVHTGIPHPYIAYPEIGKPLAAFIQYHRE